MSNSTYRTIATWLDANAFVQLFVRLAKKYPNVCMASTDGLCITIESAIPTKIVRCVHAKDVVQPDHTGHVVAFTFYLESKVDSKTQDISDMLRAACIEILEMHV